MKSIKAKDTVYTMTGKAKPYGIPVLVQFDSIRRISLRNFAFAFATFAVSAYSSDIYRKVRKGFRKERKAN